MAAEMEVVAVAEPETQETHNNQTTTTTNNNDNPSLSTYLGLSFAIFLASLPRSSISLLSSLHSRNRALSLKLTQAEEQLKQMKSRRKEDSKANARVVEIFASHRNGWQQEERKLLQQIEGSAEEIAHLRAKIENLEKSEAGLRDCVEKLQRDVDEREEMINFMSRQAAEDEEEEGEDEEEGFDDGSVERGEVEKEEVVSGGGYASEMMMRGCYSRSFEEANGEFGDHCGNFSRFGKIRVSDGLDPVPEECYMYRNGEEEEMVERYYEQPQNPCNQNFVHFNSKGCAEKGDGWQDVRYDSPESLYHMKHLVARRESPWKVDSESTGVPSKLKTLEQELLNLEKSDIGEQSKVPSLMRKQAKRYQALAGKIDDLCKRMQANDPCEQTLGAEFRTRRQTEFLLEAYRLQQRAIETGQKLTALQTETAKCHFGENLAAHAKLTTRRSLDSIKNNFREIQRNLEVWLARIMGDLEGVLSRDGSSRVKEYYISRNPFAQ